jgi:hypothetical protein
MIEYNINNRLDKIYEVIMDKRFRKNKGLGNEIGFHIFDYDPKYEIKVREYVKLLTDKVNSEDSNVKIVEFDLFEIMIKILDEKGYLDKVFEMESQRGSEKIINPIKRTLRLTQNNDLIIKYIKENTDDNCIIFLTGLGKVWPVIRSHTVLNCLHSVIENVPLVMFFPGVYNGSSLMLFDLFKDDNYYRAFKLIP